MELWLILQDVVILLGACLLVGGVFSRFGQSPIVGYLLAGMALGGPGSINAVKSAEEIEAIAELGVALLLFSLGLEFSVARLRKLGVKPLLGGAAQIVMTIVLAFVAAKAFGLPNTGAIAFGAMIALSSTAVVLRILSERAEMDTPHGRLSLGILLTQDMAVVPLALLMTILGGEGSLGQITWNVVSLLVMASLLILGLFLLTRLAVFALGTLTLLHNRELTIIFAVVMGLGAAWVSHAVGISPALGAFVAGMLLGSSAFATQIRADVAPLQILLLTLFFGAAGMVADPIWLLTHAHIVAITVTATMVGKLLVIWGLVRALGHTHRVAAATGLCLSQIGEFAFVLGTIGRTSEVVSDETYALVVSVAIVSFFMSALLVPRAARFGNWIAAWIPSESLRAHPTTPITEPPEFAIIGFGPSGRLAARPLIDNPSRVVVIDLNHESIRSARELGFHAEVGDATQQDVLKHARLGDCKAVVITVPYHKAALTILELVRQEAPLASIVVRSRYDLHMHDFAHAGADFVTGDEQSVGEKLAEFLTQQLGLLAKHNGESNTT